MNRPRDWTLGAVVAEQQVDERTHLLVVRPHASITACRDLERRLLGLFLAGNTTLIVNLLAGSDPSGAMRTTLLRSHRKISHRNGRLLVTVEDPNLGRRLEAAGLDLADLDPGEAIAASGL
jgi:hypothetical protein